MLVYLKYMKGEITGLAYLDREDRGLATYTPTPALAKTLQRMLPYQSWFSLEKTSEPNGVASGRWSSQPVILLPFPWTRSLMVGKSFI